MLSRISSFSGPLSKFFNVVSDSLILSLDAATYSGSGPWIDVIGGKSFTLYNSPSYINTDEKYFYFSASSGQYAQATTSLPSLPVFTLELWHRWDGNNTSSNPCLISETFIGGNINYVLGQVSGSLLSGAYFNGGFQQSPTFNLTASNWYQIVMSCDSNQVIKIYINNTLISTTSTSGSKPSSSNAGIRLMRRWDNPDYWGGSLGLVNIYNTALDSTKIEEKWNLNKARFGFTASGFTTNGLILRYEIGSTSSYVGSGTNVADLVGSSNATLVNDPVYSLNGYINFDGLNDYLSTNTSLNSKLLPVNTSKFISHFVWIYPTDNGVIVSEIGQTTPNTFWHDSQIEIVGGNVKFGLWTVGGVSSLNSSISTPFNNWYYVGLTYDGTTMRGYVNGQLAGNKTISRFTPYEGGRGLHYAIGAADTTSLGDGTSAKMKFGAFHIYNSTLSDQQVLNNYNYTKSDYIYTGSMSIWIDANDPSSFSGGSIIDLSGNGYTHTLASGSTSSTIYGFKSFDCTTGTKRIVVNGTGPTLPTNGYTYVVWARLISGSSSFRTLLYTNSPKYTPITIPSASNTLGYWDTAFRSSGYDLSSLVDTWVQYAVVGDNSSQTFYINGSQVGSSISYGSGGTTHWGLGNNDLAGQPFGYVGNMMLYSKKLTLDQITQNYDALKQVYKNGDFVVDNLKLYFNPSSLLSYPKTGTTVTDLTGNSLNGTLSNITYSDPYFSFNGSSSKITITDNSLLEPGVGSFTMEVWVNQSVSGNDVVLGKFDNGGLSVDVSYSIRTTNTTFYAQIGSGSGSGSTLFVNSTNHIGTLNTWYQIVYVFKNGGTKTLETFVNGSSIGTVNHNLPSILNSTNPLYIGSYNGGEYAQWFDGKIGIVRIYNSALSASDVSKNFEANRSIYGI